MHSHREDKNNNDHWLIEIKIQKKTITHNQITLIQYLLLLLSPFSRKKSKNINKNRATKKWITIIFQYFEMRFGKGIRLFGSILFSLGTVSIHDSQIVKIENKSISYFFFYFPIHCDQLQKSFDWIIHLKTIQLLLNVNNGISMTVGCTPTNWYYVASHCVLGVHCLPLQNGWIHLACQYCYCSCSCWTCDEWTQRCNAMLTTYFLSSQQYHKTLNLNGDLQQLKKSTHTYTHQWWCVASLPMLTWLLLLLHHCFLIPLIPTSV